MSRQHKIPDNLLEPLLMKRAEGQNAQKIVEWLQQEYRVSTSVAAVNARLKPFKKLEMEAKKDAIREAAAKSALNCIDIIDENIILLNREARRLMAKDSVQEKIAGKQVFESCLKYIDKKMNLSGMDKESNADDPALLLENLLKKIGE